MSGGWRIIGGIAIAAGVALLIKHFLQRFTERKRHELPAPDRVIGGVQDKDVSDEPPPPPEPEPLDIPLVPSFAVGETNADAERLWALLQQEAYRQRGEGYHPDWAFHVYATKNNLGVPLARSAGTAQRITFNGKQYGYQVFARDTLFNEIPKWGEVQRLSTLLQGKMPQDGLALALLQASYRAVGTELHPNWAFHRFAIAQQLGPAVGQNYPIKVDGKEYTLQVFGYDTIYSPVPDWATVKRLSETPAGSLREALIAETYKVAGARYNPRSGFFQLGFQNHLGTPLSDASSLDLGGTKFTVQVFAMGCVYAPAGGEPMLQSDLLKPALPAAGDTTEPAVGSATDALSSKKPRFTMLPIAGEPRISQFYGYTKWAVGGGRSFYGACQGRHPGIDFAVPEGTPLLAVGHGVVMCAGVANKDCTFGGSPPMIIIVRYGSIYAIYGHASKVNVRKGQRVAPGDKVGWSGNYGGAHLHFEIRPVPASLLNNTDPNQTAQNPGTAVNPLDYFDARLNPYFERWYQNLGGDKHFCAGSLRNQEAIRFGGPVDTRPCTNG